MVELIIVEKDGREYKLENTQTQEEYNFQIKIFDLDKELEVGDKIMLHAELLDKGYVEYSRKLQFGALDEPYGRKIDSREHKDLMCIKKGNEEFWLKRFFG